MATKIPGEAVGGLRTAEEGLPKAIELAQRKDAKWRELRATMSLARLLAKQAGAANLLEELNTQ
ncbi:MAG TPA: hypothetical protein VNF29_03670 [Candidatus Binataceae bacterium]|nr:hypothetical protein [Candidatus Binataceae bacterium]